MTCGEFQKAVDAWEKDGPPTDDSFEPIEAHANGCKPCGDRLKGVIAEGVRKELEEDERYRRLRATPYEKLSPEDKAFLDAGADRLLDEIFGPTPQHEDENLDLSAFRATAPFSIIRRYRQIRCIILVFRHDDNCGKEASLVFGDDEKLEDRYPIKCPCGVQAEMYFGDPEQGRRLLDALKKELPEDKFRDAQNSPGN